MAEISWTRRSYEATVLLLPLDRAARAWLDARGDGDDDGLTGIRVADAGLLAVRPRPEPVPVAGEGRAVSSPLEHAVHEADVVVMLTHDLAAVDGAEVVRIGDAARMSGKLLGAIIVSPGARWDTPEAHRSATALRETADNVVILKDDRFVLSFLQVLRGGPREPTPAPG